MNGIGNPDLPTMVDDMLTNLRPKLSANLP